MLKDLDLKGDGDSEIRRLTKQLQQRDNEYRKYRAIFDQKIYFLEAYLLEYKQKDNYNRKLNESIMLSYKNTGYARYYNITSTIRDLTKKHQEEITNLKQHHSKEIRYLETELKNTRDRYEQLSLQTERIKMEHETRFSEAKLQYDKEKREFEEDMHQRHKKTTQQLESKLRKAENTIRAYKDYIDKMTHQNYKNYQYRDLSVHYSFLLDDIANGDVSIMGRSRKRSAQVKTVSGMGTMTADELALSKTYKMFENASRQSRREEVTPAIMAISTANPHYRRRSSSHLEPQSNLDTMMRKQRSNKLIESSEDRTKKSRKFLYYNKYNISYLTSRISRAISSLDVTGRNHQDNCKIQFLKERIYRKLRIH